MIAKLWIQVTTAPFAFVTVLAVVVFLALMVGYVVTEVLGSRSKLGAGARTALTAPVVACAVGAFLALWAGDDGSPAEVWLLEDGGETRLAVASAAVVSKGTDRCYLSTWTLPEGRWVGGSGVTWYDACQPVGGDGAVRWYRSRAGEAVAVDLWTGQRGTSVEEALSRRELPGSGEYRLGEAVGSSVKVRLQDDSTPWIGPTGELTDEPVRGSGPAVRAVTLTKTKVELPGLHRAEVVASSCGCVGADCRGFVLHDATAFGVDLRTGVVTARLVR